MKLRSEFDAKRERMEPSWPLPMLLFTLEFRPHFMSRSSLMKLLHRF